jgi:ankyrin repeat protein
VQYEEMTTAKILIDAGAELNPTPAPGAVTPWPPLHVAIEKAGSPVLVQFLLEQDGIDLGHIYEKRSPLHSAVNAIVTGVVHHRVGVDFSECIVKFLLNHPYPSWEVATEYGTALHYAVSHNSKRAVDALLAPKIVPIDVVADVQLDEEHPTVRAYFEFDELLQATALHVASHYRLGDMISTLSAAGATVDAYCGEGFTPLALRAMQFGDDDEHGYNAAKTLIACGADVNACRKHLDSEECHPVLYYALRDGDASICELLLHAGADLAQVASTPAELLALATHLDTELQEESDRQQNALKIKFLVEAGVDLKETRHPRSGRLLHLDMAAQGCGEVVEALVASGADATARDEGGKTALQLLLLHAGEAGDAPYRGGISASTVAALVKAGDIDSWGTIPTKFPGLECLIEHFYKNTPHLIDKLFSKLTREKQKEVRNMLLVLGKVLPAELGSEVVVKSFS